MELPAVIVLSIGISLLNSLHVLIQWMNHPPGAVFTGIAHSFADYFLYTAQMAQGYGGRWIWSDHLFTNEPAAPTWYYWFNVALGHVGGWLGLSPFATYNGSVFLLVIALVLAWYSFTKTIYPANRSLRLTTLLLILTATNWYWNGNLLGQFWFSPSPVFHRLGSVPYHVFQNILFIFLAISTVRRSPCAVPLAFFAGIANPIQTLLFVIASKSVPAAIFGGIGAWLTRMEFLRQPVFVAAARWEVSQRVPNTLPMLLLSVGPILALALLGVNQARARQNHPLRALFSRWGLLSFTLFLTPIPAALGISPVRFLHPVPFASLAIAAAQGLAARSARTRAVLLAFYIATTVPSLFAQVADRITPARNPQLLMDTIYNHVPNDVASALSSLKRQPQRGVVLTDPAIPIEVLVPAFTGKPSFSGHPIHTLYPDVKERLRQEYFAGTMADPRTFLTDHRIGYIITIRNGALAILTP